jgi:hypothetical protein
MEYGDYERARNLLSLALPNAREKPPLQEMINSSIEKVECLQLTPDLKEVAWRFERAGRYDEALKLYRSAHEIAAKNLGPDSTRTALHELDMARINGRMNNQSIALTQYKNALDILGPNLNLKDVRMRAVLESYADFLYRSGQLDEAEGVYAKLRGDEKQVP